MYRQQSSARLAVGAFLRGAAQRVSLRVKASRVVTAKKSQYMLHRHGFVRRTLRGTGGEGDGLGRVRSTGFFPYGVFFSAPTDDRGGGCAWMEVAALGWRWKIQYHLSTCGKLCPLDDLWHGESTRVVIQWEGGYRFCVLIYLPETWSREKKPR
jgi:hypothetical protein